MSSRNTVRKLKIAPKPAAKQAKSHKLARIAKFPKVAKQAPKPAPKKPAARSVPPPPPPKKAQHVPALTPPKQVQQPKQSLARSFYWTELRVGDDLPPLTPPRRVKKCSSMPSTWGQRAECHSPNWRCSPRWK